MASKFPLEPMQTIDLVECVFCQRRFAANRIKIHENICKRSTEMAKDASNISGSSLEGEPSDKGFGTAKNLLSTNWRQRHEQLLQQIKIEKQRASEKRRHEFLQALSSE